MHSLIIVNKQKVISIEEQNRAHRWKFEIGVIKRTYGMSKDRNHCRIRQELCKLATRMCTKLVEYRNDNDLGYDSITPT